VALEIQPAPEDMMVNGALVSSSSNLMQVVNNLRLEKYAVRPSGRKALGKNPLIRNTYYFLRPLMSVMMRRHLQRVYLQGWDKTSFPKWPAIAGAGRGCI
jgi:hypothetical protein